MEAVREKWTDERLDDLSERVEAGFTEARSEMKESRREMATRRELGELRAEMNSRFTAMQQTTIGGFVALLAAMLVTNLG